MLALESSPSNTSTTRGGEIDPIIAFATQNQLRPCREVKSTPGLTLCAAPSEPTLRWQNHLKNQLHSDDSLHVILSSTWFLICLPWVATRWDRCWEKILGALLSLSDYLFGSGLLIDRDALILTRRRLDWKRELKPNPSNYWYDTADMALLMWKIADRVAKSRHHP